MFSSPTGISTLALRAIAAGRVYCLGTSVAQRFRAAGLAIAAIGDGSPAVTVVLLAGVGVAEVGLAAGMLGGNLPLVAGLVAHISLIGALLAAAGMQQRAGQNVHPLCTLFVLSTAWLGPVGSAGTVLVTLFCCLQARRIPVIQAPQTGLRPAGEAAAGLSLYERICRGESSKQARDTLVPFSDVMAAGSLDQKQAAIALMVAHYQPHFAMALRGALNNDEPGVRVQAATAVARIEARFLKKSIALAQRQTSGPQETDNTLALALHHDEHANTGLLDADRADAARRQALDRYRDYERLGPRSQEVSRNVIRLLVRLGRYDEVVQAVKPWAERGEIPDELFAWYAEALFTLGQFDTLRKACHHRRAFRFSASGEQCPCHPSLAFWASPGVQT